jgi:predicted metal-dependent peptidase
VGWWDAEVHGEQIFEQSAFGNIRSLLKPAGGGGTRVSSVSDHLVNNNIKPDCLIVMTDGYVEPRIDWRVESPTLWLVTQARSFAPPVGRVVKMQ